MEPLSPCAPPGPVDTSRTFTAGVGVSVSDVPALFRLCVRFDSHLSFCLTVCCVLYEQCLRAKSSSSEPRIDAACLRGWSDNAQQAHSLTTLCCSCSCRRGVCAKASRSTLQELLQLLPQSSFVGCASRPSLFAWQVLTRFARCLHPLALLALRYVAFDSTSFKVLISQILRENATRRERRARAGAVHSVTETL